VVQAAINGVAGNFLVDTGAQATTVNTAHFAEGQLQTVALDHGRPSGVGGALADVRGARGLNLTWGEASFEDLRGIALDLSHLEASIGTQVVGLIGYDVLERFEIHFDYAAGLLTLYRLDKDNRPVNAERLGIPKARITFDMVGHLPVLPARLSGQELRLGLDTGAAEAMLAEKWEDPMAGQFELIRIADIRGADKAVRPAAEVRFDSMTVSNIAYEDVIFRFGDILLAGGGRLDMDGLLGYQFLSTRPTSINFRARELGIW
jgi:predicted aspartyl protease